MPSKIHHTYDAWLVSMCFGAFEMLTWKQFDTWPSSGPLKETFSAPRSWDWLPDQKVPRPETDQIIETTWDNLFKIFLSILRWLLRDIFWHELGEGGRKDSRCSQRVRSCPSKQSLALPSSAPRRRESSFRKSDLDRFRDQKINKKLLPRPAAPAVLSYVIMINYGQLCNYM